MMTDLQIWHWTLTKEAIAPCFVRDVLAMRHSTSNDTDFFWLGHTPCRTVLVVGMVVAIQVYDKRAIYTIDDGTAVIDCVLRHPIPPLPAPANRSTAGPSAKTNLQRSPPKKPRLGKVTLESMEPPPPFTEPGYPVRVVGKVVRHYASKQIHADTIDPCPSSLDEIAHLERVIELHKAKYSRAVPFVVPPKPTISSAPLQRPTSRTTVDADASIFSDTSLSSRPGPSTASYTLPAPPRMPMPLQDRNRPPPRPPLVDPTYHKHAPSSPTASSIASSTPSSPCKPSSSVKAHEPPHKPRLRHPSRLHTRDLTTNTFRLYVKHYMDNAPPPFAISCPSPSRSTCGGVTTPTKHARDEGDEPTPRPPCAKAIETRTNIEQEDDESRMGFTLSHLRRVPELALLASRIVRAETRKRDKADREKERANAGNTSTLTCSGKFNGNGKASTPIPRMGAAAEAPRKKMKRLFSWAVVKLYEEGSIVLWDGDVRPLPVLPPAESSWNRLWNDDTRPGSSTLEWPSVSRCVPSTLGDSETCTSASVLYTQSASATLYSHYHAPRRHCKEDSARDVDVDAVDADADPGYLSDPPLDEEAYVPLTVGLLAGHVREAAGVLRREGVGRGRGGAGVKGGSREGGTRREPTAEDVLAYMQRKDARWARVGVWVVEEALATIKAG